MQAEFVMRGTKDELEDMREILNGKQDPGETPRQAAARMAENERKLRHRAESTAELDECLQDFVDGIEMYTEKISIVQAQERKLKGVSCAPNFSQCFHYDQGS